MKTLKMQFMTEFPYYHELNGMPTLFRQSIIAGTKIHTIRKEKHEYEEIKQEIKKGNTVLNLWNYESTMDGYTMQIFNTIRDCHFDLIVKKDGQWLIGKYLLPVEINTLAVNEGLTLQAFQGLWPLDDYKHLTIFYLTDFNYIDIVEEKLQDKNTLLDEEEYSYQILKEALQMDRQEEPNNYLKVTMTAQLDIDFGDIIVKRKNHFER